MRRVIRSQMEFDQHRPNSPSEVNRRAWHLSFELDETVEVWRTGNPLVLPKGLNTTRAMLIQSIQDGETVGQINGRLGKLHSHAEDDGDIWIGVMRGYFRLEPTSKRLTPPLGRTAPSP